MSDPSSEWGPYIQKGVEWTLNTLNFIALGGLAWIGNTWRDQRAKLHRLEKHTEDNDKELGEQKAFRIEAMKAPFGVKLNTTIRKLKARDRVLHQTIDEHKDASDELTTKLLTQQATIQTDIAWIKEELKKRGNGNGK